MARSRSGTRPPVVVVTGASAGVGRATAIQFAQQGWDVGLIARGRAGLTGAAEDVRAEGRRAHLVACDVSSAAEVDAAADQLERELGTIDVWVNNAMVTVFGRFDDLEPDEFERVVDVTFLGSVWGTRAALRRMRSRDEGVIVQVGSALADGGIPLQSAYCASKYALDGFVESVRSELREQDSNVSLRVVQMPALNTPQLAWGRNHLDVRPHPVPPVFEPDVAAEAVHHVATNSRSDLLVGASTVGTMVGDRRADELVDTYLAEHEAGAGVSPGTHRPGRRGNLFEPMDDALDFGARGPFDDQAKDHSIELEITRRRGALATVGAALAAGAAAAWWANRDAA